MPEIYPFLLYLRGLNDETINALNVSEDEKKRIKEKIKELADLKTEDLMGAVCGGL